MVSKSCGQKKKQRVKKRGGSRGGMFGGEVASIPKKRDKE